MVTKASRVEIWRMEDEEWKPGFNPLKIAKQRPSGGFFDKEEEEKAKLKGEVFHAGEYSQEFLRKLVLKAHGKED